MGRVAIAGIGGTAAPSTRSVAGGRRRLARPTRGRARTGLRGKETLHAGQLSERRAHYLLVPRPTDRWPAGRQEGDAAMEGTQGRSRGGSGPGRHRGQARARGWLVALALVGLGASALAPAADPGGDGARRHRPAMTEIDGRRHPERHMNPRAESSVRSPLDSNRTMNAGDEGQVRIEAVSVSATGVLVRLRAEHYARACKPPGHLCDLIAAHVRGRIAPVRLKRVPAMGPALAGEATPDWQDVSVANSADLHAPRRPDWSRGHAASGW